MLFEAPEIARPLSEAVMVDRSLWRSDYMGWPHWPCPTCDTGRLILIRDSLQRRETGPSVRSRDAEEFGPYDVEERFSALLECNNPRCKQVSSICGSMGLEQTYSTGPDGEEEVSWDPVYFPKYIEPAPAVFRIPTKCPKSVRFELEKSFALIWSDLDSGATRMRAAVEILLNELGVRKTAISKGKRLPLTLHARIERYKTKNAEVADKLLAIKWIGNLGSHSTQVPHSLNELMDGFELFANAIDILYVRTDRELRKVARSINKRRGRRSSQVRR
jgi:hypothetical protein